ncbi:oxygen-insensitive NAD(P)H nitroreductase [Duganella aceris]|uniref:Oxygen-insensitive NAD(P)H nitroreductase n=1 Tax=Duganella aceris TaxID=2703883 RepID=A0ABX0FW77_9BURK|nr:oxygen-insensitive NAD(P)H nitroreductase [Duganella aceris]NGZ88534.1 oxygen-insensitive NAD(P)H nitroreductase [Duganella aceris]
MDIVHIAAKRHTVKSFDQQRRIPDAVFERIRELLRLAPSSVNSQPWHFFIASTQEGKERVAQSTDGDYQYNSRKIREASHVIVLTTMAATDAGHDAAVLAQEVSDGRFADERAKVSQATSRASYTNIHRYERKDLQHWYEKQTYLALGTLLLGAAALEVDATPMEGFDSKVLEHELGLNEQGLTATVIVSLGYSGGDDFNAKLPKSRLSKETLFTDI